MATFEVIEQATAGDGTEVSLARRGDEWVIRAGSHILMSSRMHGSEEALADVAFEHARSPRRIVVGGLGLGYTLRAVLDRAAKDARVVVAELLPAVVTWNRDHLGHLAGRPLDDPRVSVSVGDVADTLASARGTLDVVLLDVDNGPEVVAHAKNAALYSEHGIRRCRDALAPGGVLAVWSAGPDARYAARLAKLGFGVETVRASARGGTTPARGAKHVIFVAKKSAKSSS